MNPLSGPRLEQDQNHAKDYYVYIHLPVQLCILDQFFSVQIGVIGHLILSARVKLTVCVIFLFFTQLS